MNNMYFAKNSVEKIFQYKQAIWLIFYLETQSTPKN